MEWNKRLFRDVFPIQCKKNDAQHVTWVYSQDKNLKIMLCYIFIIKRQLKAKEITNTRHPVTNIT